MFLLAYRAALAVRTLADYIDLKRQICRARIPDRQKVLISVSVGKMLSFISPLFEISSIAKIFWNR